MPPSHSSEVEQQALDGHRSIQSTMTYAQISDARRNRTMALSPFIKG
jgi:hypothetical protein